MLSQPVAAVGGFVRWLFLRRFQLIGGSFPRLTRVLLSVCLCKKKVSKEKAHPRTAPGFARFPSLLVGPGGCGTRGYAPQTVLADIPRPACVARRLPRGPKGVAALRRCAWFWPVFVRRPQISFRHSRAGGNPGINQRPCLLLWAPAFARTTESCGQRAKTAENQTQLPQLIPTPALPLKGRGQSAQSCDAFRGPCGRRRAAQEPADEGRGLSEARRAEFRSPRRFRAAQGTGRSPAPDGGCLFFGYFLLAKQKKVCPPVNGGTQPINNQKR